MSYKVGQVVRIVANTNDHGFKIGEKVLITRTFMGEADRADKLDGSDYWFIGNDDIEEIKEEKTMQKSDLRTGMRVETVNGNRYLVLKNIETPRCGVQPFVFARKGGFQIADEYNEDLSDIHDSEYSISKVYDCPHLGDLLSLECSGELLWEQTEVKEMTLADIEKKLGYPIKIIE